MRPSFKLPFEFERTHLLVFLIVFFVVLFAYDQSRPPTIMNKDGIEPTTVGGDTDVSNNTVLIINDTGDNGNNTTNITFYPNSTVFYPNPENTTEAPLELNATGGAGETVNSSGGTPEDEPPTDMTAEGDAEGDEPIKEGETGEEEQLEEDLPKEGDVTYYFFWADYCSTCKTMMPWIEDVADDHPKLIVKMIDLYSGSSYIQRFQVASTAVSVIIRTVGGEDVSGTKMVGFMDKDAIERLACTELDDAVCDRKYPNL